MKLTFVFIFFGILLLGFASPSDAGICIQDALDTIIGKVYPGLSYQKEYLANRVVKVQSRRMASTFFILKVGHRDDVVEDFLSQNFIREVMKDHEVEVLEAKLLLQRRKKWSDFFWERPGLLQMKGVKGRTLYSIFADPYFPADLKAELRQKYTEFNKLLKLHLEEQYQISMKVGPADEAFFPQQKGMTSAEQIKAQPEVYSALVSRDRLQKSNPSFYRKLYRKLDARRRKTGVFGDGFLNPNGGDTFRLILKSDNFLVTDDFKLVLIDPK